MKAIIYEKHTHPECLNLREALKPVAGSGQVLVRMVSTSLNALDYRSISIGALPKSRIFGAAIAGVVEAVGAGTKVFAVGDAVMGDAADCGLGGLAEYVAVPENILTRKPASITFEQAAALPVAATTALQALRNKGKLSAGQKVLVYGASGGVGIYAIQMARLLGAEVTALCSEKNIAQAQALGASYAMDYRTFDFKREVKRFDLIVAINGNQPLRAYLRLLHRGGRLVVVGGALSQIFRAMFFGPLLSIGSKKVKLLAAKPIPEDLAQVATWVAEGRITPVIDRRYPLAQTAEAMRYLEKEHSPGKVIIDVAGEGRNE